MIRTSIKHFEINVPMLRKLDFFKFQSNLEPIKSPSRSYKTYLLKIRFNLFFSSKK